jgi:hypothetical protein
MTTLTTNQALERWDTLSDVLREALCSEINSDFLWKTCEVEHISDEKIYAVARIAGTVLMGFLHPEDMAAEIRDSLGIDLRVATSITNAINQRIFAPLRTDIDRVYNPSTTSAAMPKILEEVRPPAAASMSVPAPRPPVSPVVSAPAAGPPTPKQEPIKPVAEKVAPLDEFARIGKGATPSQSQTPAPKPFILQTESTPRPILNAPDFRVPIIAENIMGGKKGPEPLPTRAAVVEFSGMPIPKPTPAPELSTTPKVTAIHYGSENTTPMKPPTPEPMRTITEITPETLKTQVPIPKAPLQPSFTPISQIPVPSPVVQKTPTPVVPPTSTQPPASPISMPQPTAQPEKVVQKDYSQ